MIKRIQSIKNLGVYSNYTKKGDLPDFNDKNIFYGWNYSGKTTLSRLFSFLENKKVDEDSFPDVDFEIILHDGKKINKSNIEEFPNLVRVFNSDFIRENLRFDTVDKKIKGIAFDIGDNAHLRPLIEQNDKEIEIAKQKILEKSESIKLFDDFENNKIKKQASNIQNGYFNSLITFDKRHFSKLISDKQTALDNIIQSEEEIIKIKANSLATDNKEKIDIEITEINFDLLREKVNNLLLSEPQKNKTIQLLDDNSDLYDWSKLGYELHEKYELENCAFCNSKIEQQRKFDLNSYYTNQAAILKTKANNLIGELNGEIVRIKNISLFSLSKNDLTDSLQKDFEELKIKLIETILAYEKVLNKFKQLIEYKIDSKLFESVKFPDIDLSKIEKLIEHLKSFYDLLEKHNKLILEFEKNRENSRIKYQKHLVSKFLIEEDYFEIERKKNIELRYHAILKSQIKKREIENQENLDKLKDITAGKKELNDFIKQFLKRDDILIDVIENDYFVLKRGDKIATNLSEGEKTAIAFSHFLVSLNSLHTDGKLVDTLIFIDDPISSLDANHIAQISSMINSFFFRKGLDVDNPNRVVNCFIQLFVSTHNFEFYSFLRDANNIKRAKKEIQTDGSKKDVSATNNYLIKKESCDVSTIIKTPSSLISYKSEYIYLFSIIYEFYVDGCKEENNNYILMPNAIRRFLEIYTLIKLPGSKDEIDNRIKELVDEVNELKVLHHFSHFTTFEKVGKQDELILKLPDITEDVFTLLRKDISHYSSLCKGINKETI